MKTSITATTRATMTRMIGSRFTKELLSERESIQKRQVIRNDGEASQDQQHAQRNQQCAAGNFDGMHVDAEAAVELEEALDPERGQQKWHGQSQRIDGQQHDSFCNRVLGGGES